MTFAAARTRLPPYILVMVLAGCGDAAVRPEPIAEASAVRGRQVVARTGCGACHTIPGVAWPKGRVGPSLAGFGGRSLIAGRFPNRPDILVAWVRDAPALSPQTGMPPMPLTEREARDVAAYLYTLEPR